jgi:hypothetical protein
MGRIATSTVIREIADDRCLCVRGPGIAASGVVRVVDGTTLAARTMRAGVATDAGAAGGGERAIGWGGSHGSAGQEA